VESENCKCSNKNEKDDFKSTLKLQIYMFRNVEFFPTILLRNHKYVIKNSF